MPRQRSKREQADDLLIVALACGASVESAARQASVCEKTVRRRLKDATFQQQLREMQADIVKRTAGALTAAATESVRTLLDLQKPGTPPATRLGAARTVIELGIKMREIVEIETRIAALEDRVQTDSMAVGN